MRAALIRWHARTTYSRSRKIGVFSLKTNASISHCFHLLCFARTAVGNDENNLPFLFLYLPPTLKQRFPEYAVQLRQNARRLVTGFDIHQTLRHLLHLQTESRPWTNDLSPDFEQESFSLLTPVPTNRTCESAGIPAAYCSCYRLTDVDPDSKAARDAAVALVARVNEALRGVKDICVTWQVARIVRVRKRSDADEFSLHVETTPVHYGTKPGHFQTSKIHFPTSEGVSKVSKRANK